MRYGQFLLVITAIGCGREIPAKQIVEIRPLIKEKVVTLPPIQMDQGEFPELIPLFELKEGLILKFHDGPDFYTWTLTEDKTQGERYRSGLGIYFGNHPDLTHIDKSAKRIKGVLCNQEVDWWSQTNSDANDRWLHRDALINYKHGKEFCTIRLHAWVWGPSESEVAKLAQQLEALTFRFARER